MNKLEKGYKRYRRVIEKMTGWDAGFVGVSYETFCAYVNLGNHTYEKYVEMSDNDMTIIDKHIKKLKLR